MKYLTHTVAAIAATLYMQPCPAPLLVPAVAGAVSAAAGAVQAGAAVVGAGAAIAAVATQNKKRGEHAPWDEDAGISPAVLQKCVADMFNSRSVSSNVTPDGGVVVYNCPESCKEAVDEYNSFPDVDSLAARYGTVSWNDSTITTTYPVGAGCLSGS
ncbi:uncharacterized protein RCC_01143 [Ramularia collo-cygni]|uniref:Uncharacterized protein n=1 Tax=Ramularia collo-cygni TaxID=112498 RepID=A0A2D3V1A0_9PEZI|nr:uncharacterized protein RCC_01143 [Ramularia collo-cygni]CZT15279.1 uncharacterized protein RCC_01143 [Ramularia collo-cygni]